jgi:hypothetical protein
VYFAYKNREETFPSLGMLTFGAHAFNSGVRRMQMASLLSASSLLFQFCWRCQKLAEPQPLLIALSLVVISDLISSVAFSRLR